MSWPSLPFSDNKLRRRGRHGDSNEAAAVIASIARTASQEFMTKGDAKDEGQGWREDAKSRDYQVSKKHAGWSRTTDPARVLSNCGGGVGCFGRCDGGHLVGDSWAHRPGGYLVSGTQ